MITSAANPRLKTIRALLARRRAREQAGRCVLEGARLVGDALDVGAVPEEVLYTPDFDQPALLGRLREAGAPCRLVAPELAATIADTETPQGIWAVCALPELTRPPAPGLWLVLDQVRDPGNVGAILRTAAAAGVDFVALLKGTVDPFNPKVLRAGMGAHFRVPLGFVAVDALPPLVLADAGGALRYDRHDWTGPAALAIGGEAHGFSPAVAGRAQASVYIPMARATESLNAAAAAAVILFEARRQRLGAG